MTEDEIRAWLLGYAWLGDEDSQAREVDCIMSQDRWRHLGFLTERIAAQASEPGPKAVEQAHGYALSSLYECHDGPHLDTCPMVRPAGPVQYVSQ